MSEMCGSALSDLVLGPRVELDDLVLRRAVPGVGGEEGRAWGGWGGRPGRVTGHYTPVEQLRADRVADLVTRAVQCQEWGPGWGLVHCTALH